MTRSQLAPQRAVILAAGLGSRLRPLTELRPKPLVEVHGVPILHNALNHLATVGVTEVTLVVGYRKEAIEQFCGSRFAGIDISYVVSTTYERTGSAYSLWLAREHLRCSSGLFLLEGDVFFEQLALRRLLEHESEDVAAVSPFRATMQGSSAALSSAGLISKISVGQESVNGHGDDQEDLFKTLNLYRLSAATIEGVLIPELCAFIEERCSSAFMEEFFANLVREQRLSLAAAHCHDLKWCEIDTEADLIEAEAIFGAQSDPSYRHMMMS